MTHTRGLSGFIGTEAGKSLLDSGEALKFANEQLTKNMRWGLFKACLEKKESASAGLHSLPPSQSSPGSHQHTQTPGSDCVNLRPREFTFGTDSEDQHSKEIMASVVAAFTMKSETEEVKAAAKRRISLRPLEPFGEKSGCNSSLLLHQCWKRVQNGDFVQVRIQQSPFDSWKVVVLNTAQTVLAEETIEKDHKWRRMTAKELASVVDLDLPGKSIIINEAPINSAQITLEIARKQMVFNGNKYDLRFTTDPDLTVLNIEAYSPTLNLKRKILNDMRLTSTEELGRFVDEELMPRLKIVNREIQISLSSETLPREKLTFSSLVEKLSKTRNTLKEFI